MSKPKRCSFVCSCGQAFEADIYKSVNVTAQPELKEQILAGRFNQVRCSACHEVIDADVPFLYHDMNADVMVWVYPSSMVDQADAIRAKIRRSHEIVGSVLPYPNTSDDRDVVFGVDGLRALIDLSP